MGSMERSFNIISKCWSLEKTDAGRDWGAGGEGDDRGWDGWMASLTRWTWVWVNSRSWWWTGRPGVLQFMGSQRVGHDWATELKHVPPNQKYAEVIMTSGTEVLEWWYTNIHHYNQSLFESFIQIIKRLSSLIKTCLDNVFHPQIFPPQNFQNSDLGGKQ